MNMTALLSVLGLFFVGLFVFAAFYFRTVVKPNQIHIVNRRKQSMAYGRPPEPDKRTGEVAYQTHGNAYYGWPAWVPFFGVTTVIIPLANFDLDLYNYEAYDDGKVPFMVDIKAFFRVSNPIIAAQRINLDSDLDPLTQLKKQLLGVLEGTSRSILAKHEVRYIMTERSTFGKKFTDETQDQLPEWGVTNIKNIELMDVRDARDSRTISNIMAMKESSIEKESRVEVAANQRDAKQAEIDAARDVSIRDQEARQQVGERTAEQVKMVGIAEERAAQEIKEQARETMEREKAIRKVEVVRDAEIKRDAQVVQADEDRQTDIIKAEGVKQQTVLIAEGDLVKAQREGEGIRAIGEAKAEAERLLNMAEVSPQIKLAEEIGENKGYQTYLVDIRNVEQVEAVGVAQAEALKNADVKVIVNGENASGGMSSVIDLVSGRGGLKFAQMLEQFSNTSEEGAKLIGKLNGGGKNADRPKQ